MALVVISIASIAESLQSSLSSSFCKPQAESPRQACTQVTDFINKIESLVLAITMAQIETPQLGLDVSHVRFVVGWTVFLMVIDA